MGLGLLPPGSVSAESHAPDPQVLGSCLEDFPMTPPTSNLPFLDCLVPSIMYIPQHKTALFMSVL